MARLRLSLMVSMTNFGARIATLFGLTVLLFVTVPSTSTAHPLGVSLVPPAVAFELDDLDLRDGQNRPIKSVAVRADMRRLFQSNLTQLLLQNLTPVQRSVRFMLMSAWELWRTMLRRSVPAKERAHVVPIQQRRELVWTLPYATVRAQPRAEGRSWRFEFSSHLQSLISSCIDSTRLLR